MNRFLPLLALAALTAAAPAAAQQAPANRSFVELLAGAVVPTFDIADVAKTGTGFGVAFGTQLGSSWVLMGEVDYGMHKDKATNSVDITTMHYIAKLGYSLTGPRERGLEAVVNLGAGAVSFEVDGTNETKTYPAINAGAKLIYNVNRSFGLVLSPQGDIAFTKESELSTTNAWVWPITAGIRMSF